MKWGYNILVLEDNGDLPRYLVVVILKKNIIINRLGI